MIREVMVILLLQLGAVILPGPDFAIVSRYSVVKGRQNGLMCALGVTIAVLINFSISFFIGASLIKENLILYRLFITLGLVYLLYISYSLVKNFFVPQASIASGTETSPKTLQTGSFRAGLLTNLSNAKAIVFFSSLVPLFATLSQTLKFFTWCGIGLVTFSWFVTVAILFTKPRIRHVFLAKIVYFELVIGLVIMVFSIVIFCSLYF